MRKFIFLFIIALSSVQLAFSQLGFARDTTVKIIPEVFPEQKLNVGWVTTDAVANLFSLEGQYRVNRNAYILGLGTALGLYDVSGEDFETELLPISGVQIKVNHKYYIGRQSETGFFSAVHGPAFQQYSINYESQGFEPFEEDGVTYLRPTTIEDDFSVSRLVYDARIQYEYIDNFFFAEFGLGFSYRGVLSKTTQPSNWNTDGFLQGITFVGIRPSLQLKFGIYLDGEGFISGYQK